MEQVKGWERSSTLGLKGGGWHLGPPDPGKPLRSRASVRFLPRRTLHPQPAPSPGPPSSPPGEGRGGGRRRLPALPLYGDPGGRPPGT